jgi:signal transduction histidine kinase/DNA-binding response OmpR family regulator
LVGDSNPAVELGKPLVNILLVEDNLAEARLLAEILKGTVLSRFQLTHVKRLAEAVSLLDRSTPASLKAAFQVILLDLTLPDSQGLASLNVLTQRAPSLPIVVLTNTNDDELALQAMRHGAQDYLVKRHINQDILERSLRYAIERKQTAEALREANEILELRVQERTAALAQANDRLWQEVERRQRVQERLELAQQAGKIGTFEWNLQSNQVTWTAELEALYSVAPGGFHHCYDDWIAAIHADDRDRVDQELWQAIQNHVGLDTEFRIVCPTGERWIAVKSSVFCDRTNAPLRMIGVHIDITDKKQLETQFLRAQRLESLGTLASGIAHDLNNILTPILAVVQLLPLKLTNLDEHTRLMLKTVEASAQRGAGLVKQILSFARGVEGKRVCLQISDLLLETEKIIRQTFSKSIEIQVNIQVNVSSPLWTVFADVTQLHQVLMNLCVNARDAMPHGGTLQITAENLLIDESFARMHLEAHAGAYVLITVADTGIGMSSDTLRRIFDPFFTTKEIGKGTGLGLSAVLGIVKSHGGFIDVHSQVNQGSQFKVYLPAIESPLPPDEDELEFLYGQQELILVVDDEVAVCETTKTTLETYNYRVLTASDGIEAVSLFAQHQADIHAVLIDMMMPSMDGRTAVSLLRQLNPETQVVAMSGLNLTQTVAPAELGFQNFLAKPFTTRSLLQALHGASTRSSDNGAV